MSRLIELMDAWLEEHGDHTDFTASELVELTNLLRDASIVIPQEIEPVHEPEAAHAFDSYYQQLLDEKKQKQQDLELQQSLSLPNKINWKYYRDHKYLLNIP